MKLLKCLYCHHWEKNYVLDSTLVTDLASKLVVFEHHNENNTLMIIFIMRMMVMAKNCYEVHLILLRKAQSEEEEAGQKAKNQNQKELLTEMGHLKGKTMPTVDQGKVNHQCL